MLERRLRVPDLRASRRARRGARAPTAPRAVPGSGPGPVNPLLAVDCPDPAVLRLGRNYYLYSTSGGEPDAFPIRHSTDLEVWERVGCLFPRDRRPAWAVGDFWAPEVHRVGRRWVAYFTARDRTGRLCIGTACAPHPGGPWSAAPVPLVRDERVGMIDSHAFRDRDGRRYLYWKEDGNDLRPRAPTPIYAQPLSPDGLGLQGERRAVLVNDLPWEGDLVEGPWLVRRGRWYYLFYSGSNYWEESYAVGVARALSPRGPFVKRPQPVLARGGAWAGPGHGCVVRAPDGRDLFIYHAWQQGRAGGPHARMLLMEGVEWSGGWPRIGAGSPSGAPPHAEGPAPE